MHAGSTIPMTYAVLAVCLAASAWHDVRRRRIPNAVVWTGLVATLVAAWGEGGWAAGLRPAALGALAGLAVSLPFYAVRALGAGDAKLMAVVGGALGTVGMLQVAALSICAAGVIGLVMSAATGRLGRFVSNLRLGAVALATRDRALAASVAGQTSYRVPFAVAVAVAAPAWLVFVR